jgi:hypothetical protein
LTVAVTPASVLLAPVIAGAFLFGGYNKGDSATREDAMTELCGDWHSKLDAVRSGVYDLYHCVERKTLILAVGAEPLGRNRRHIRY